MPAPMRRLLRVVTLIRYRFFLYAGLLPYLLGAAWAYASAGVDAAMFWSGLGGVVLAVIGVEAFNEYFDARMGTDRVFNPADLPPISDAVFWCGVLAFAGAFAVGTYISVRIGWPILAFALLGGLAGIFYEAPPIRWSYRGLGELVIGLAYGPWMVLGSLYLNTHALSWEAFAASLVPGLSIMSLAVVNAIPDYHQDLLVGKRNLVVRLGRAKAVVLYLVLAGAALAIVAAGVVIGIFPADCTLALLALLPLVASGRSARSSFTTPRRFLPAVRYLVTYYTLATGLFAAGIVLHAWRAAS
jgi:1,4-dihydroxy-2-naphthoate octaprenyltransferase